MGEDILAVVSKAIFEKAMREENPKLAEGVVWATKSYASAAKGLTPLADGGRLFLVTVRPPDEALWLVAILDKPKFNGKQWTAKANTKPITDVSGLKSKIRFASGVGMPTKAGVLGMSLQTPRALTAADAELLANAESAEGTAVPKSKKKPATKTTAKTTTTTTTTAKSSKKKTQPTTQPQSIDHVALLVHWKKTRSPRVADLLQCAPVDAGWDARLSAIAKQGTSRAVRDRLVGLPDDPRTTVFLIECLRKARWPGSSATTIWKAIFKKLVSLEDRRAIAPLRAFVTTPPYFLGAAHTKAMVEQIASTADDLEEATKKQKRDDDDHDAATKALVEAHRHVTIPKRGWFAAGGSAGADAALQNVWAAADPTDEGVRAVAADALLEQEDPWGELITLQLSNEKKRHADRVKKLLNKHASRFAGPIAKVAPIRLLSFEKGFLSECTIGKAGMIGRRLWEDALKAPHWATVHTVHLDIHDQPPKWWVLGFYAGASLKSLRVIKIGSFVLTRDNATAAWKFKSAPQSIDWRSETPLAALLRGMGSSERKRIPIPASKALKKFLEGRDSEDWDPDR